MDKFSEAQVTSFKETFVLFDKDGDGLIGIKDIGILLRAVGQILTQSEVQEIIESNSVTPTFDFSTFLTILSQNIKKSPTEEEIQEVFNLFDKEKEGRISTSELKHVLTNIGEKLTPEEIDEFIRDADPGNEGQIQYPTFLKLINEIGAKSN